MNMKLDTLHIIPIVDTVILPYTETKLSVDEELGERLLNQLNQTEGYAIALSIREGVLKNAIDPDSFYDVGSLLKLQKVEKASKGYLVYASSLERLEVDEVIINGEIAIARYHELFETNDLSEEGQKEMLQYIKTSIHDIGEHFQGNDEFLKVIDRQETLNGIIGHLMPLLSASLDEKYALILQDSIKARGLLFLEYLSKQREVVELQVEMAQKYSKKNSRSYRENLLREQLKAIQQELGEGNSEPNSVQNYRERIEESKMTEEARKAAMRELNKLETSGSNHSEGHIIRNYLDTLLELPWENDLHDTDIKNARQVLDRNHYGMDQVKKRIMQHLAVMKIQNDKQGSILLLVGPPGTGKTSLGKSIAEALEREYVRISLGGVRDEAEIRGHRRTYLGALPGRIIQGMKKAGTQNPVFVLDEIDKLTASNSGDPSSALLEVLDPEQNDSFADHYLEVPYDLSSVLFVATANNINTIPRALLDRLEVIQISSYTNLEKFHIARNHLVPNAIKDHGLKTEDVVFKDEAITTIIDKYTRESGVRTLKKNIDEILRNVIEKIVLDEVEGAYDVGAQAVEELLGRQTARHDEIRKESAPGVVTGLAWTPVGGDILFIEGTFMPGKGHLMLTGQLGDVMKESAKIALSLVKSRLTNQLTFLDFNKNDIHLHVPSGATPKDGPSAGVTILTALASLATGKKVESSLAMTGEVTLSGYVLPVGGIKEKILAAHRAGIKKVLLPKDNERDLKDVPEEVREAIEFIFVEQIEEVLTHALDIEISTPLDLFEIIPGLDNQTIHPPKI
jgi:ATP-dependent Lon protease